MAAKVSLQLSFFFFTTMTIPQSTTDVDAKTRKEGLLDFSNQYWGDKKCVDVVAAVRQAAPAPIHLDLRGNRIGAEGAKVLADMLISPHSVASLCLEWNNVGYLDVGVEAIATALEADTKLVALDLRNNNVGPEGAKALARALRRNQTLRRLDLRWNEIGGAGVLAFREALHTNESLLTLELTGNNCSLKQVDEIDKLLARNQAIQAENRVVARQEPVPVEENPACSEAHTDKLLLHVLAEKEELEAALGSSKKEGHKLVRYERMVIDVLVSPSRIVDCAVREGGRAPVAARACSKGRQHRQRRPRQVSAARD